MEQFRKIIAYFRLIKHRLNNHPWINDPKGDVFRSFKILLILAGIKFEDARPWQRICWTAYHLLSFCAFTIILLCSVENLLNRVDVVAAIWYTILSLAFLIGQVQHLILRQYWTSVRRSTEFINGKLTSSSKDSQKYSTIRRNVFRKTQLMSYGLLALIVFCVLLAPLMLYKNNRFLRFPSMFQVSDGWIPKVVYFALIWPLWPYWVVKKLSPTVIATALLAGFEAEMRVLVGGFQLHPKPEERSFEQLNDHVRVFIEKHTQLMENLRSLRPVINKLFFTVYYNALLLSACFTYILVIEQLSNGSVLYIVIIVTYALECYWWSSLAESYNDVCNSFEDSIFELLGEVIHGPDCHRTADKVRLCRALMIAQINVRQSARFNCGGLFSISIETFGHLLQTMYSLLTFLLNVAKPEAV